MFIFKGHVNIVKTDMVKLNNITTLDRLKMIGGLLIKGKYM